MTILGKKQMSEEDIKLNYITPVIQRGWKGHITMETKITDGRINIRGNIVARSKPKFVDYMLYLNDGKPIAVVEAKDNNHSVSHGLQQATAPESLGNILYTPDGYASQVHLNESLSRAAFTAAIPLNDCSLKGDALELGHLEGDISGSGGEIAVVVAAAVALTSLAALIAGRLRQRLRLLFQQLVQGFLHAAANQFLDLALDYFLV